MANGRKNLGPSVLATPPVPRAVLSDTAEVANLAANATEAAEAFAVIPTTERGTMDGTETLALLAGDRIQPLALADLFVLLESRYGLTPLP